MYLIDTVIWSFMVVFILIMWINILVNNFQLNSKPEAKITLKLWLSDTISKTNNCKNMAKILIKKSSIGTSVIFKSV